MATGGPVKAVLAQVINYGIEHTIGERLQQGIEAVHHYAGSLIQNTNVDEFGQVIAEESTATNVSNLPLGLSYTDTVDGIRLGASIVGIGIERAVASRGNSDRGGSGSGSNGSGPESNVVRVNTQNATVKNSPDYDALNNLKPNTRYELDNGTTFRTNSHGHVEEITFIPVDQKVPRDSRQTAVGNEGFPTDVGGHIQACSMGGTCDRYNLFPQDRNFNNGEYKKWENEIRNALQNGDNVGPVTVRFRRTYPNSSRPDALRVEYSINGEVMRRDFRNQPGG